MCSGNVESLGFDLIQDIPRIEDYLFSGIFIFMRRLYERDFETVYIRNCRMLKCSRWKFLYDVVISNDVVRSYIDGGMLFPDNRGINVATIVLLICMQAWHNQRGCPMYCYPIELII